jgi:hypothetical protein
MVSSRYREVDRAKRRCRFDTASIFETIEVLAVDLDGVAGTRADKEISP